MIIGLYIVSTLDGAISNVATGQPAKKNDVMRDINLDRMQHLDQGWQDVRTLKVVGTSGNGQVNVRHGI